MRFIDTNLFLRYFTRDDKKKAQRVFALLKRIEENKERVITSGLVIFETIFTLQSFYKVRKQKIKELMLPILNLKGLKIQDKEIYKKALDLYVKRNISFTDAFNASFLLQKRIQEIYSYDESFEKIKGIKRIKLPNSIFKYLKKLEEKRGSNECQIRSSLLQWGANLASKL